MACIGRCGTTGTCGGTCDRDFPYTRPVPGPGRQPTPPATKSALASRMPLCSTLARDLIATVDSIRDLNTQFGLRPYVVSLVKTRWSGSKRGVGAEELVADPITLLPTPRISDMSGVAEITTAVGLDEFGEVILSEVSGSYTEDFLRGADSEGRPPAADENFFYEIEFPPACTGGEGDRRRFFIRSAPMYFADRFQWNLRLERQRQDRTRAGDLR